MENNSKTTHMYSMVKYHFVFCSRLRRKIFNNSELQQRFLELLVEVADQCELTLFEVRCEVDHVYLYLSASPNWSPADIMTKIKYQTSKQLRLEFHEVSHLQGLWTRAFFVSTESVVSKEEISHYVQQQKSRC